jgi:2-phospho-L-lactate transferase/gluconeogenesis factor (CofD/UPF0052 family)
MNILIFNGGRGAGTILKSLKNVKGVNIAYIVNAYDDGKSTGEIRKYFDMLGPSDIRKVQSTLLKDNDSNIVDFFNYRFDNNISNQQALNFLDNFEDEIVNRFKINKIKIIDELTNYKNAFINNFEEKKIDLKNQFNFRDCSLMNCLYAGGYKINKMNLLDTIKKFKKIFEIEHDVLPNSEDNLKMIALRENGQILFSESEIVSLRSNFLIHSIFLIDPKIILDKNKINDLNFDQKLKFFQDLHKTPNINTDLKTKIKTADIIIYSPGTQHSSLLPTYLTKNVGKLISNNKKALKVFITNIGADYENPVYIASDYVINAQKYLEISSKEIFMHNNFINFIIVNHNNKIYENKVNFDYKKFKKFNIKFSAKNYEDKFKYGHHDGDLVIETIIKEFNLVN